MYAIRSYYGPEFVPILDKALKAVSFEQKLKIQHTWTSSRFVGNEAIEDNQAEFSPEEQAWIDSHPKITVRSLSAWPPINFVTPEGKISGSYNFV